MGDQVQPPPSLQQLTSRATTLRNGILKDGLQTAAAQVQLGMALVTEDWHWFGKGPVDDGSQNYVEEARNILRWSQVLANGAGYIVPDGSAVRTRAEACKAWFHITDQALYDRECVYDDLEMRKAVLSGKYNFTEAVDEAKKRKRKRKSGSGVVDEEAALLELLKAGVGAVLHGPAFR